MLVTLLDRDNFLGRILTGRIASGKLTINMPIHALDPDGKVVEEGRATKIMAFRGLERVPVESAERARSSPSPASPRRPSPTPSPTPRWPRRSTPSRSTRRRWR